MKLSYEGATKFKLKKRDRGFYEYDGYRIEHCKSRKWIITEYMDKPDDDGWHWQYVETVESLGDAMVVIEEWAETTPEDAKRRHDDPRSLNQPFRIRYPKS